MGLSEVTSAPATREDCAVWLHEVFDGLGVTRASIISASYGGFLALNYAISEPERVKKLVLTSPAAGIAALPIRFYVRLFALLLIRGSSVVERIMEWLFADRFPLDHPVIQQVVVGGKCLNARPRLYPKVFGDSELAGLPVPVYLLFGEKEVCYDPNAAAERARRIMPTVTVEIVPSAGHLLVMERPDYVNARILEFLKAQ
jgi:pimeloyl-ACP methyl ester carboxylesterase